MSRSSVSEATRRDRSIRGQSRHYFAVAQLKQCPVPLQPRGVGRALAFRPVEHRASERIRISGVRYAAARRGIGEGAETGEFLLAPSRDPFGQALFEVAEEEKRASGPPLLTHEQQRRLRRQQQDRGERPDRLR
ncbi:MAG: hypothetical protein U5K43_08070 [Halofilum sp. (in: g-proteobacteria)]|nr:hypothetical protein [Halofilum sp. (in: g-proteobacteria)]